MKDNILLRTMTLKSVFTVGKHINHTVEFVLRNDITYLVYTYYNIEKITFTDDILKLLKINKPHRFKKPGINKDLEQKHKANFFKKLNLKCKKQIANLPLLDRFKRVSHRKKVERIRKWAADINLDTRNVYFNQKQQLQGINHGRYGGRKTAM